MTPTTGTILLAHGSRSPGQLAVISDIAAAAQAQDHTPWRPAFLDHHGPTLAEAAADLVHAGCRSIIVVPALLSHAFHAGVDVPAAIDTLTSTVAVTLADPIGPDMQLFEAVTDHLDAARAQWPHDSREVTIVVCAAGSSDEQARTAFSAAVGEWAATRTDRTTDHRAMAAFIAGGAPHVTDAVSSEVQSGRAVVVVPFTLARGALTELARSQALEAGAIDFLPPLGAADSVISIVLARRDACVTV